MGFFASQLPPPPPFHGALGSLSCERGEYRVIGMNYPMNEQQQGWGFRGFEMGRQGCHGDENDDQDEEAYDKDHANGHAKLCARGHWRPAEDAMLKDLVAQYGPQNWNLIAEKLEGRSGKSCRLRWFNQLDPRINRRAFSDEEEEKLLAAHRLYGNKWALIARLFHGRTDNAVKNHWHVIMARRQRERSSSGYRRKKSLPINKRVEVKSSNNACSGESTITSTRDESPSNCTIHGLITQQPKPLNFLMGSDESLVIVRNGNQGESGSDSGSGYHRGATMMLVNGLGPQSGCYNSKSGASAAVSVANKKSNEGEEIRLPFIDFLGVGST